MTASLQDPRDPDMTSTYTEYLSSHYPPKVRRRWRLLEILQDHRVRQIAGWDLETVDYLRAVLRVLCSEEPEVGRWPVLRLPLSRMPGGWWGEPRRVKRCEQRLVELGAIIPRGSRADLQPHWSDPATGMTYAASGIDLSPMDDLAAKLEAEAPKLVAAWKECYALHERLRRLNARMRRHIRAAVPRRNLERMPSFRDPGAAPEDASCFRGRCPRISATPADRGGCRNRLSTKRYDQNRVKP